MKLYQYKKGCMTGLREKPFPIESHIQSLLEANLSQWLGLEFVRSEFYIKNKKIDTLAYDRDSHAFIIIEYKRGKNHSVIDQGFTYLSLMLENKANFVLAYNETLGRTLHSQTVDWSQTRLIFVSQHFTEYQKQAVNFKDIAIELYEIKRYEGAIITVQPIQKTAAASSIKPLAGKGKKLQRIASAITVYTEDHHTSNQSDSVVERYETYRDAILNLAEGIEIVPRKWYIAFKKENIICAIRLQKDVLKLWINLKKGALDDPKNLMQDVSGKGHLGNGDYELKVGDTQNLEYIMSLIKQAL